MPPPKRIKFEEEFEEGEEPEEPVGEEGVKPKRRLIPVPRYPKKEEPKEEEPQLSKEEIYTLAMYHLQSSYAYMKLLG